MALEEVTGGNKGGARATRMMTQSLGKQTQLQYNALDMFDYGDAPPPPSPTSPHQVSPPLQRNGKDDDSDGGNAAMGAMYRGQGRQLGGRVMQSAIVGDAAVFVGGGGGRTEKTPNYKTGVGLVIKRANVV